MNVVAKAIEPVCFDMRGRDLDQVFAMQNLSDTALTAAYRVCARFDPAFPGWQLYRRIAAGIGLFDRHLEYSAIAVARRLARSEKLNGRSYISGAIRQKNGWIAQAGRDALDFAIYGRYPASVDERARHFGIWRDTYKAVRNPIAAGLWIGVETFRSELHAEYLKVRRDEKRGS